MRFYCRGLPSVSPVVAFLSPRFALGSRVALRSCRRVLTSIHACRAVLPTCFALGSRVALRFYCPGLPSIRGWHCGSIAAFCLSLCPGSRLWQSGCPRFACSDLRFWQGRCSRFTRSGLRFYRRVLPSFTPVFFPLSGKKKRLAISCVPIPPGRDRHSCVLAVSVRLSALVGSLRVCAFICGDLDGVTERRGTRGTGLAARR